MQRARGDLRFLEAGPLRIRGLSTAKLNLFLEVLGRRPDGYHELVSVFHEIDLADQVEVELLPGMTGDQVVSSGRPIDAGPLENLALRAVRRFRECCSPIPAVRVRLEKRIPVGGGLGGGSSNAAFVLDALQVLSGTPNDMERLTNAARELGSDVPFFLRGGNAIVYGRGERVEPLPLQRPMHFALAVPSFGSSTATIYRNLTLDYAPRDLRPFLESLDRWDRSLERPRETPVFFNRLEEVAFRVRPELRALRDQLQARTGRTWSVTGSGAVLYTAAVSREDLVAGNADIENGGGVQIVLARSFSRAGEGPTGFCI